MNDASAEDRQAILEVIKAETDAYYNRDFEQWADYWEQDEGARRLGMLPGGQILYLEGWHDIADMVSGIMEQSPQKNPEAARLTQRENLNVRVDCDMAWVSFDESGAGTGDSFDPLGVTHQVRFLEKRQGRWRIAFIAHGEKAIGYFRFPVVTVEIDASIIWMNEAAREALKDHPALSVIGGRLRTRWRSGNAAMHKALAEIDSLNPIQLRRSVSSPGMVRRVVPVVLESEDDESSSIFWVTSQDGVLSVSFNDTDTEAMQLDLAKSVYGLSPAQTRLAACIIDGQDLTAAADSLGITINTARTHLKRMFEKTGVRSQTTLVRVLMSVEPPSA